MEYLVSALTETVTTKTSNEPRKRGGQPGNKNAFKHGNRTHAAITARKLTRARLKGLSHLLKQHDLLADDGLKTLPRPIRADQWLLLAELEPELARYLAPYVPWPEM